MYALSWLRLVLIPRYRATQAVGWSLRNAPRKPSPWELGLVIGLSPADVERPCEEWEPYLEPYRQKIADIRRMVANAGGN